MIWQFSIGMLSVIQDSIIMFSIHCTILYLLTYLTGTWWKLDGCWSSKILALNENLKSWLCALWVRFYLFLCVHLYPSSSELAQQLYDENWLCARCCPSCRETAAAITAMNPDLMKLKRYIKEICGLKSTQAPISFCHMDALLQCLFHNEPYLCSRSTLKWHSLPTKKFWVWTL